MFILGPVLGLKFRMCFFAPSCIFYTFKEFAPWAKLNMCVCVCVCVFYEDLCEKFLSHFSTSNSVLVFFFE